jgi:hypothetical protein
MLCGEDMAIQVQLDEPRWPEVDDYVENLSKGSGSSYMSDHEERMSDLIWWEKTKPVRPKRPLNFQELGGWDTVRTR